jgi:SPX domain protein involved in polyphosphate accumulation
MRIERFVNMNFNGYHKILKKHDKNVSAAYRCKVPSHNSTTPLLFLVY